MQQLALILSDIRSTYNVGSIMRSADCFGISHIFFAGYTPYPKTVNDNRLPHQVNKLTSAIHKTALGAEEFLQFSVFEDTSEAIKSARSQGYVIAALEQHTGSTPLHTFKAPAKLALVLGNEVKGIARQTINDCDVILEIPMFGKKESLNVSITAAIAMYSLRFGVK